MIVAGPGRRVGKVSSLPSKGKAQLAALARHSPHQNHLLDALPSADYERLAPHLELIPMKLGDVLDEPGVRLRHVYFPTTSIVSLPYGMEGGASAEIAIVDNQGIRRISLCMRCV